MPACSPQRFLANNRNLFRDAVIAASSVLPVTNNIDALKRARDGTAQARLTGTYTGDEEALYEFEILDTDVEVARVSAPTSSGAGSQTLTDISATGVQQVVTIECADAGIEGAQASISVAGQKIVSRISGTVGNAYRIAVDQSGLTFTDSGITTLADLQAGQGGSDSPFVGPGYDWGQAALDGNGLIPDDAIRIAFGDDESSVHLPYKDFADGEWRYFLIPALTRDVPKGTAIKIVTGGRTVTINNGGAITDLFTDIETNYDLLNAIRTGSALVDVVGIVANDRSPTGQASRELSLRTDAHAQVSTGTGSSYAKGLENVTVAADAGQQLVTFSCFATSSNDHPNARLGHELWQVKSSLLGDLGIVATGERFSFADFAGLIPVRLPPGYGEPKGHFSAAISYATRGEGQTEPPICPVALALGSDPVDGTYTFVYSPRPSGDCDCTGMPVPRLNPSCLGTPTEGGQVSTYQPDTVTRLIDLYDWYETLVRNLTEAGATDDDSATGAPALVAPADGLSSGYPVQTRDATPTAPVDYDGSAVTYHKGNPYITNPPITPAQYAMFLQNTQSIKQVVENFEAALAEIDPLTPASPAGYRENGNTAWDASVLVFENDIEAWTGASSPFLRLLNIPSERYDAAIKKVLMTAGISALGKTDASTVSGDGCWRDWGDAAYWVNTDGDLLPMFTNHPYIASRLNAGGRAFSTHNFGLQLNVKCPGDLQYGDTVTITISGASYGATYQQGDEIELGIVAAAPLFLSGGVTGSPVQTWNVNGSVDGPFPPYSFNPDSPAAYLETAGSSTIGFQLVKGGIPAAKGDRFRFAIEGGHYQWRKDGGAWNDDSPPLPIPVESDVIDSGLSVSFVAGAASSFVAGDLFAFRARQPWAVSNTLTPNKRVWKWDPSASPVTPTYSADFSSIEQLDLFATLCTLPDGASATLWGGADPDADDWSEPLTIREGCIWKAIDQTARYVRIVFADAADGSLQYPWIGVPVSTTLSAEVALIREFRTNRPGGNLQGGRFIGKAISGNVSWTEAALSEADAEALIAMLEWVKEHDDEPILFIPQITRTDDPVIVARIGSDEVEFVDHAAYNQNEGIARRVSCSIPLDGVLE